MDKKPDAPVLLAPGVTGGASSYRLPPAREWPTVDDHLDEPEVTRRESIDGVVMEASPALAEHGDPHLRLDYLVAAHLAEGYIGSVDLKTRVAEKSDFASDTCIRKEGTDPKTGRRYLEELVFEVVSKRKPADVKARALAFSRRGVRRQIAIFVGKGEVCEWSAASEGWRKIDPRRSIRDRCLAHPLPVVALLDAGKAELAVVRALEAKDHPGIVELKERSRAEGRAEALLTIFTARGWTIPDELRARVLATRDLGQLDRWLEKSSTAPSLDQVFDEL